MKSRPRKPAARGLSLVELLIASVILALTGTLLAGGLMSANRGAELRAARAVLTQQLAGHMARLPEVVAADAPAQAPCPDADGVSCTIRLTDGPLPSLKQVTVSLADQGHHLDAITLRPIAEP